MFTGYIVLIIVLAILATGIGIGLAYWGIKMCLKDNAMGLIPLFIGLNILGLIIGGVILYNNKNKGPKQNAGQSTVVEDA